MKAPATAEAPGAVGPSVAVDWHERNLAATIAGNHEPSARLADLLREDITAEEILDKKYSDPKWIVKDLLPEGLAIIAGKPKVGKSWLALNVALAVSLGGRVLGQIEVERREVLYLALEDTERRIRRRLDLIKAVPARKLFIRTVWERGAKALEDLRLWLSCHPECGLVIIDTMGRIREPGGELSYQQDVDFIAGIKQIADGRVITIVMLHHCRKAGAEDFLDLVSGTNGIAGSADTIWVLSRTRGGADAILDVTGRDIEEKQFALHYDLDIGWTLMGDAKELKLTAERQEIVKVLRENEGPMTPTDVADVLGKSHAAVKQILWRMSKANEIGCQGGRYHAL